MGLGGDRLAGLSPTVLAVYERVLAEILAGERVAGSVLRDVDLAAQLGVSRTPVREAIQLLRAIGVVEVRSSRFTRIAEPSVQDLSDAGSVSLLLYEQVIQEVLGGTTELPLSAMLELHDAAGDAAAEGRLIEFFSCCFRFHDCIVQLTENPHLARAIDAVVHALRLALVTNHGVVDTAAILHGQDTLIQAFQRRDGELAHQGVLLTRGSKR